MSDDKPKLNIRFLYAICNDVKEMRRFYTELLGMQEGHFMDSEDWGWLTLQSEGMQLMFFRWSKELPVNKDWAWQPGGTVEDAHPMMSFSVLVPWENYRDTYQRLKEGGVKAQTEAPQWRQSSYWGWTIADPMGNTIEVYAPPPEKPAEGETPQWQD